MILRILSFTSKGKELENRIVEMDTEHIWEKYSKTSNALSVSDWLKEGFAMRCPIIIVGAVGIAVRIIAPFVRDKLQDSPVIVIDEAGSFVIPVLSGHMGGANAIAKHFAELLLAVPVITTATDVNQTFSCDTFAKMNGFRIGNREGIREISKKVLEGSRVKTYLSQQIRSLNEMPDRILEPVEERGQAELLILSKEEEEQTSPTARLTLYEKPYVLGIGCKKDTGEAKIRSAVKRALVSHGFLTEEEEPEVFLQSEVFSAASIDLKRKEYGLNLFLQRQGIPFFCYSGERLNQVSGVFSESEYVMRVTGVSNVCERAAICCCGEGELVIPKRAEDGVTVAMARRTCRVRW